MTAAADLEARIVTLERKRFQCPKELEIDDSMHRARSDVEVSKKIYSAKWKWVPTNYYDKDMVARAKILQASSTLELCKALVLENKKHSSNEKLPRFVLVMLQYEAVLDPKKLSNALLKQLPVPERASVLFDWRVASPEDNDRLTGYAFNSVTPFGLLLPNELQIILADAIPSFFWMGGGHVHLKLGMAKSDFVAANSGCIVADVSSPRSGAQGDGAFD